MVLFMPRDARNYGRISIKVSGKNLPAAISHIENTWRKFLPETPFEYTFLDENFDRLYKTEDRQKLYLPRLRALPSSLLALVYLVFQHLLSVKE
jgi:hypothetical protein